jgi:hypothetical protein
MTRKDLKLLFQDRIKDAIHAGKLPAYRYNVSIRMASCIHDEAMVSTWIAGIEGIHNTLKEIFDTCKEKYPGKVYYVCTTEPDHPSRKEMNARGMDVVIEEYESRIQVKVDEFLKANPAWAGR